MYTYIELAIGRLESRHAVLKLLVSRAETNTRFIRIFAQLYNIIMYSNTFMHMYSA